MLFDASGCHPLNELKLCFERTLGFGAVLGRFLNIRCHRSVNYIDGFAMIGACTLFVRSTD